MAPSEALTPEPVELVTTDATHIETASEPLAPDEVEVVVSYRHKGKFRLLLEWVGIIVVALSAAFLIRLFVFQTFYIPSISMVPTLQVGDRIIVSKLSTELGGVHRGDVVVFRPRTVVAMLDPHRTSLSVLLAYLVTTSPVGATRSSSTAKYSTSRGNTLRRLGTPLVRSMSLKASTS